MAPEGTDVTILVAVGVPVMVAVVPLNLTMLLAAVLLKLVPVMVTEVPMVPEAGLNPEMVGLEAVVTVKLVALMAVAPPTSTVIVPVVAPAGTAVTILVVVGVPLIAAVTPLNLTILLAAVVLKLVPVMVTEEPTLPAIGLNPVMVGTTTVKSLALVTVTPSISMVTLPVVAPTGTEVTIVVAVGVPVMEASVPLNFTMLLAAVVLKFVPVNVTEVPTKPEVGFMPVKVGAVGKETTKSVALVAVSLPTCTVIFPVVAPVGTDVTILVEVGVPVMVAVVPLNFTILLAAVVLKLVPVRVIVVPTGAEVGLNPVKVGAVGAETMKSVALVAVFPATSTVILPMVAPVGTIATILVVVGVPEMVAVVPLNFTILLAAVVLKLVPVIVTELPIGADVGLKLVIVGGPIKVNPVRVAVPPGVVTLTLPDCPAPTTAEIVIASNT